VFDIPNIWSRLFNFPLGNFPLKMLKVNSFKGLDEIRASFPNEAMVLRFIQDLFREYLRLHLYEWEECLAFIQQSNYEMGSLSKEKPGNLKLGIFALIVLSTFHKAVTVNFIKIEFLRNSHTQILTDRTGQTWSIRSRCSRCMWQTPFSCYLLFSNKKYPLNVSIKIILLYKF
jgi:hypothetical protein